MVNALAFYSEDPSFNIAEEYSFSVKFVFEKNENNNKRGRILHIKKVCDC